MIPKRTRIIATIGPSSESPEKLSLLVRAGLDVARFNFSHGSGAEHQRHFDSVREVESVLKTRVAILADLAGPKIRTGDLATETVTLEEGKRITLTTEQTVGTAERMSVSYEGLVRDVKPGAHIVINDGKQRFLVEEISGNNIECRVLAGGTIRSRRGVNFPGTHLSLSVLTEKDREDVQYCVKQGVDAFAMSFVQSAKDIRDLRILLSELNSTALIMAKIETASAIERLDKIIDEADAIMVARGDLAVEVGAERVPFLQKTMIAKARAKGKIVVVATQMLESMIESPVPTRAEVSDVANAILDGTDAIMLSAESAVGAFPTEAIETMTKIAVETETHVDHNKRTRRSDAYAGFTEIPIIEAITRYAAKTAIDIAATVVVALTETGFTARMVGRYRTQQPLVVVSSNESTLRQTSFLYGAYPLSMPHRDTIPEIIEFLRTDLVRKSYAKKGDTAVLVSGMRVGERGGTDTVSAFVV
ncbi:pyruvate kinase [bacterium]|nr:pyruvate kinase [bacterium]